MTVTTTAGSAVALLLYGARSDRTTGDALAEAILDLREVVGPQIRGLVDRWMASGSDARPGPDGEQIYCLDHLLRERCAAEPRFRAAVERVVGEPVAREALTALAGHCRREGFAGALAWCEAALSAPVVLGQAAPLPVNRTVTAPR